MSRFDNLQARINAYRDNIRKRGFQAMWYMILAETLVDMLTKTDTFTKDELLAELKARQKKVLDCGEPSFAESFDAAIDVVTNGLPGKSSMAD